MSELSQFLDLLATEDDLSADSILNGVKRMAYGLGFTMYAHHNFYQKTSQIFIPNAYTYPEAWIDRYYEVNHYINDPTLQYAVNTCFSYPWCDIQENSQITRDQQLVFDEASEFGLKGGLSIPIRRPGGNIALLSFSGDVSQKEFRQIWSHNKREFTLLGLHLANRSIPQAAHGLPFEN